MGAAMADENGDDHRKHRDDEEDDQAFDTHRVDPFPGP
jgi:hypothetical protein